LEVRPIDVITGMPLLSLSRQKGDIRATGASAYTKAYPERVSITDHWFQLGYQQLNPTYYAVETVVHQLVDCHIRAVGIGKLGVLEVYSQRADLHQLSSVYLLHSLINHWPCLVNGDPERVDFRPPDLHWQGE